MLEHLTIGEIAQLAGLQTSTLRYYESIGILPAPKRVSGQRRYSTDILPVLAVIQLAKEANFSLSEIRALLYGMDGHSTPSKRWQELARHKIQEIDDLISRAQDMKALLEEGLECDSLLYELDACKLLTQPQIEIAS